MKILAITHNFPNEGNRNHGIFAARQIVEMRNQGAEIIVIVPMVWCPGFLRNFKRWQIYNHKWRCEYKGIRAITVPYLRLPGKWFRPWAQRTVFYVIKNKVLQLYQAESFDVIFARFLHPEGYTAVRLSKILGIPAVGVGAGDEVNVYPFESKIFKRELIRILNELDGVMASGRKVATRIAELSGKKPLLVHGVVDLNEFSPAKNTDLVRKSLGLPLDKLIVLYVGTFKIAKGVFEMIEAFVQVQHQIPNVIFKICGYGRQERKMQHIIERACATKTIEIVGQVDSAEVHKWMQASDLFVLASHAEGMPNVVMEAMACGLPVVATEVGGLPEAVADSGGVILVPPKDVDALVDAVLRILQNKEIRKRMSSAARKRAEERFSATRNAKRILSFFSKIIKQRNKAR